MNWLEAIELERQVFGGNNLDLAQRLVRETTIALMYVTDGLGVGLTYEIAVKPDPDAYCEDVELDELATLMGKADQELGGE